MRCLHVGERGGREWGARVPEPLIPVPSVTQLPGIPDGDMVTEVRGSQSRVMPGLERCIPSPRAMPAGLGLPGLVLLLSIQAPPDCLLPVFSPGKEQRIRPGKTW